jgi:DNA-binding transcriptional LysR family regulator
MDRLQSMTTFLAAVEAGSLSAASRKLGIPLATVSRKVSELEAHLRTRLVNRTSRHLTLTDAGRSYVEACKRIIEDIEEAERAAAGEYIAPRGDLHLVAPVVFGRMHVLPVVTEFLQAYPDIDIRLVLADRMANLIEEHVDLAVRIGALPDSSQVGTKVGAVRRVVCGSPGYFARRGIPEHPTDLAGHDCITFEGLMSPKAWHFRTAEAEISAQIHSRLTVNTAEAAVDAAIAGLGITRVLSYQMANARRAGALVTALELFEPPPVPVNLVYPGRGLMPLKLRAFLDFAGPRLRARL